MKYKNKYFREVLEKDLKEHDMGVNIHCKEDGIYMTVPPYPPTGDEFTDDYGAQILREDYDTERLVKKIKDIITPYGIEIKSTNAVYGDNIKIKLNINELP
jgi:hypothetical protein